MRPLDALVCAVAAIALVSSTARAQPPPLPQGSQDDPTRLPEVSVTAPARLPGAPLPLSSVPATVNVVPGDRLHGSGAVPLDDVERIEVIRWPAAVFGRNTLGGAINIISFFGQTTAYEIVPEVEGGS